MWKSEVVMALSYVQLLLTKPDKLRLGCEGRWYFQSELFEYQMFHAVLPV